MPLAYRTYTSSLCSAKAEQQRFSTALGVKFEIKKPTFSPRRKSRGVSQKGLFLPLPRDSFTAVTFIGFNSRENIFSLQAEEKGEEESIDT